MVRVTCPHCGCQFANSEHNDQQLTLRCMICGEVVRTVENAVAPTLQLTDDELKALRRMAGPRGADPAGARKH
jgi:transcription elongation factor Elf1